MMTQMRPLTGDNTKISDRRPPDQAFRSPIALTDRLLVLIRWALILASGVMSHLEGFGGSTLALPMAVWLAVIAYNLPISFYAWRRRPLANGRGKWLLWVDLAQATLTVVFMGGYRSFYFVLFLLAMTDLALAYPWRVALTAAVGIGGLEIAAMTLGEFPASEPFAVYLVVGKFILSILVGGLVTVLGELLRREDAARQAASRSAAQVTSLNSVLMQLGESGLNLERTLVAILTGTHLLSDAAFSLVLLPDATEGAWQVAASNSERYPVGERVSGLTADQFIKPCSSEGMVTTYPLPQLTAHGFEQCIGISLCVPDDKVAGVLIVGFQSRRLLSEEEQGLLRSLAQEAGMALRNARLCRNGQTWRMAPKQRLSKCLRRIWIGWRHWFPIGWKARGWRLARLHCTASLWIWFD